MNVYSLAAARAGRLAQQGVTSDGELEDGDGDEQVS